MQFLLVETFIFILENYNNALIKGHMGSKMVVNLAGSGLCDSISIYDANPSAAENTISLVQSTVQDKVEVTAMDLATMSQQCSVIFSMLPNDIIVNDVSTHLLKSGSNNSNKFIHVSCSTISPTTSRSLEVIDAIEGF
jgi:3-hydroxyisobutyrate dehydrogenase-like beta-hydroxyacid dehydrogenase